MLQSNLQVGLRRFTFMRMGVSTYRGETYKVMVRQGWPDRGLIFYRKDLVGGLALPARPRFISSTTQTMQLANGITELNGVEVFLAAVYMSSNWDLEVQVTGAEVPSLDGSALPWVEAFRSAELFREGLPPQVAMLRKKIELKRKTWSAVLEPSDSPSLTMSMELDRPGVGKQEIKVDLTQDALIKELAPARQFGFHIVQEEKPGEEDFEEEEEDDEERVVLDEFNERLKVDLRRSLVFDKDGKVENEDGQRFPNEPVRFKALGLVGDLALLGVPLFAKITCQDTTHAAHKQILRALEKRGVLELISSNS